MNRKFALFALPFLFLMQTARAHCPLCTAGAALAAGGAAYLGVHPAIIGLLIGAFAVSTGFWTSRWIKKNYFKGQKAVIILLAFVLTIVPILPLISSYVPLYIPWMGDYGRTFSINIAIFASILGGVLVVSAPPLSRKLRALRNGKLIPFQGVLITLSLLVLSSIILQVVL